VDTWRDAYRGIVPQAHLDAMDHEAFEARWRGILAGSASVRFVAEREGRVEGLVSVGPLREPVPGYTGETWAIYVRPDAQRRGLGRALMREGARALVAAGHRSMLLWVLADNARGRAFHDRLGGRVVAEKTFEIAGATLPEVACGWDDLPALASIP
jgi:L-amino acid N-acyltransferase YncA